MATTELESLLGHGNGFNAHKTSTFFQSLAKTLIKFTIWVLFLSWVSLFFIVPSDFGANLYDHLVAATTCELFGETGSVFLIYSGPILVIAFLAVPYLKFSAQQQEDQHLNKAPPRFRLWTFPILVDGPFGVVSGAELIVMLLFVVFVLWALCRYSITNFEILATYSNLTPLEKRVELLQMSAYCFGLISLSCLAFLFLPVARGSILLRLINVPFEHATRYHVWLANLTMFLLTLHCLGYIIEWKIRGILLSSIVEWKSYTSANFAGVISYAFGLLIWITTLPCVKKRCFELFFYTHQLYILFVIFMALHIGDTKFSKVAGGIFLFMLDRFLRFCQSRKFTDIISVTCFPCGSLKLVLSKPKSLRYNALSFIFLQVRELSWLQWHPFSVSSSPLDGNYHLSILIKDVGGWTTKLRQAVSNVVEESETKSHLQLRSKITASIEGPYGHESPYYLTYENLVLVAGGSGISPFLAILSDIVHRIVEKKACLPKTILIVWAVKRSGEISLLSIEGLESTFQSTTDRLHVEVQIYITQESEPLLEEGKTQNAISSLVLSKGHNISVLVGTEKNIWLGTYVMVSTIGLVLVVGLLDAYYINRFSVSYLWYKGLLFVASMVVSILVFGGFMVVLWDLWERRALAEEGRREADMVHCLEQGGGKDLFQETLANSIATHYGCRPDFEEIFQSISDRWGHVDVGVIVCGPPTLESSVAKECRSRNLRRSTSHPIFHFNSHSFSL